MLCGLVVRRYVLRLGAVLVSQDAWSRAHDRFQLRALEAVAVAVSAGRPAGVSAGCSAVGSVKSNAERLLVVGND